MALQHSSSVEVLDIQVLAAHVSTKGSCNEATANPLGEEPSTVDVATMGLYIVGDQCTCLVALGKVYHSFPRVYHSSFSYSFVVPHYFLSLVLSFLSF